MGKRRVTAMLDESDITELEAIAEQNRVSLAWVIRAAISNYLESEGQTHLIRKSRTRLESS
ncbi:ribbon-helix-helix domain-containing protein [Ruegeria sp. AU67]|uniref:ribbon-helix-helix domain-containing protein n=1 Tax=Ruegeria sp. AU67 TaxID=2108530 RepID=UPI000D68FD86|nr:ribbon-helix-helix domain-containing protein [Ruegeria sp. AU67]